MSYKAQIMIPSFTGEESSYIEKAIEKGEIACKGENSSELLNLLLKKTKAKHGLLVANGTAAIHLALKAAGVTDGDIVFCPTFTYCGTAYPIIYERAIPVFIDCKPDGTLDPGALEKALIKYKDNPPKAVIAVDTYGAPADYDEIKSLLAPYKIPLIADSAESLGGSYKGRPAGSFGDISIVSFSYSKTVTTSMGGAIFSDNEEYIKTASYLANQAKASSPCYLHREIGYNYLMSNLLAGMGIPNLKRIESLIERKREVFLKYKKAFSKYSFLRFCSDKEGSSCWYNGIITDRGDANEIIKELLASGIEVRNGFNPMHNQEAFSGFDYVSVDNNSMELFKKTVLIPSGPGMDDGIQDYVIEKLTEILERVK